MIRDQIGTIFFLFLFLWGLNSHCLAQEKFAGTGIQAVPVSSGEIVVLDIVDGSPAQRSGLLPGDLVVQVDDYPLEGSDFEYVVRNYLWGKAGEILTVVYMRPGKAGQTKVELVREPLTGEVEKIPGIRLMQPKAQN